MLHMCDKDCTCPAAGIFVAVASLPPEKEYSVNSQTPTVTREQECSFTHLNKADCFSVVNHILNGRDLGGQCCLDCISSDHTSEIDNEEEDEDTKADNDKSSRSTA